MVFNESNAQTVTTSQNTEGVTTQGQTSPSETPTQTVSTGRNDEATTLPTSQVTAPKQYVPNYKFKVVNEEKEFDEFVRPLIKDEETEKKFRDLYTKAHGLEPLKTRLSNDLETAKSSHKEVSEKYTNISRSLAELSHHVQNSNFDAFFKSLQIPEQKIYEWVSRKLQERELPPEQRAELERNRQTNEQLFRIQQENEDLRRQFETTNIRQHEMLLDQTLNAPEYAEMARTFDSSLGKPGSFKMEIIKRGALLEQITGKELPVSEVIADFMGTYGKFVNTPQANTQGVQTNANPNQNGNQRPPTIPHVQSQGGAPVKKIPRTIDELRSLIQ